MDYWRRLTYERKVAAVLILFFSLLGLTVLVGIHNNYSAYDAGVRAVLAGQDPYPADWRTAEYPFPPWYIYSPTFGYFFIPFSSYAMGPYLGSYVWVMLNFAVYAAGVWSVLSFMDREPRFFRKKWFLIGALLLVNEMMGSLTNLQSNGFITGAMLLAAGLYLRGRPGWAAFLLALGTNFKVYPIAAALLLCLDLQAGFILLFALITAAFFLFPLLFINGASYLAMLHNWFDLMVNEPLHTVYLGLEPTLLHYGYQIDRTEFLIFTLMNAAALALASYHLFRKDRENFIRLVIPALLGFIILFNKRAESQTFISIVPVFAFMLHAALRAKEEGDDNGYRTNLIFLIMGWMLISWIYSDLAPKPFRVTANEWHFKTLGAILLYLWAWAQIVIHFANKMQAEGTVVTVAPAQ